MHVNRPGFESALAELAGRCALILETGTSAWGTDSTRLWDAYVRIFGGEFWSVDSSEAPRERLRRQVGAHTHLVVEDSVTFLQRFATENANRQVNLCYLDSWDLDWNDPLPAEKHGLREWAAIAPLFGAGSILIVDDSPSSIEWVPPNLHEQATFFLSSRGYLPGKGALIEKRLAGDKNCRKIWHGYNSVFVFDGVPLTLEVPT